MQKERLTLGSLFDGSGGFPLGGLLAGIQPIWASEIEPFPIRVTTKQFLNMKHYGDISQIDGARIEPVDIITFGSPCQDMSVAGKRSGLDGSRSSLFYQAIRVIKEMREATNGKYPKYTVWENVPGAFSSNNGKDFQQVLEQICRIKDEGVSIPLPKKWNGAGQIVADDYSVAWRELDAQFWGVPQRRKRIYLVADFDGRSAGKILFESEGLSGYTPQGFRAWQKAPGDSAESIGETGGNEDDGVAIIDSIGGHSESYEVSNIAGTLKATHYKNPPSIANRFLFENHSQDTRYTGPHETAQTVSSTFGMGGNNQPFVVEEPTPKTLKIRSGFEKSGERTDVLKEQNSTLRAEAHHPPLVMEAAGFCTEHSANARSIGYEEEKSPTLRAGVVPAAITLDNHPTDGRVKTCEDGIIPTLTSRCGISGNNVPIMMENEEKPEFKAYGICALNSNSMKSSNPNSGFYEAKTTRTLDANGGNPSCNQGGMAVVALEGNGSRPSHHGDGYSEEDVSYTLNATEQHGVAYTMTTGSFTQWNREKSPTIAARDYKDHPIVNEDYIVRRLTPTECARLQGFPDWWCSDLGTEHPTSEEVYEWYNIFETHRKITSSSSKPKTEKQIRAFLQAPHSDSAEYKMWGNGVALPCVYFVLSGIAWAENQLKEQ